MVNVEIPREVKEYEATVAMGLSARQIISVICCLLWAVPVYLGLGQIIGQSTSIYIVLIGAIPIILIGFYKIDGIPMETYLKIVFKFLTEPQKRVYKYIPEEEQLHRELIKELSETDDLLEKYRKKNRLRGENKKCRKKSLIQQ